MVSDPVVPQAFVDFIEEFNQARYWESHEVLETAWRRNGSRFYKGMIIYASAFVHAQRGNPRGVRKQLHKAKRVLAAYRPAYLGIDLESHFDLMERCLEIAAAEDAPEGSALTAAIP